MTAMTSFEQIEKIMREQGDPPERITPFRHLYRKFLSQQEERFEWRDIASPSSDAILKYEDLEEVSASAVSSMLSELAVCRLNGGLGTSMGCVGPKSAIEVKNGQTFLDLIVTQIQSLNQRYGVEVPLVLMNSFNTDADTRKITRKYNGRLPVYHFQQNQFPRLRRDSMLPVSLERYGQQCYYPPGHGDFYQSIAQSGILDQLIAQGKKYLFVANADNLGASVDLRILNRLKTSGAPFIMEVTQKTRADIKGGTLIRTPTNALRLLEVAQVPRDHMEEFKSVKKFNIFNTNNVWLKLDELKRKITEDTFDLDVIVNQKTLKHLPVIQLETALGSAISNFADSLAVKVPRIRFLPIKKTDDLLLIQSNLFLFKEGILQRNPARQFDGLPLIRLGEAFQDVEAYHQRFQTIPDILELDLLTVVGDVYFGKHIVLRGNVILVCESGELHLPDHSQLENKVLTGRIRMGEL
jgi:UTP--glucose-1-phosphate uridylyltransferase